MNELNQIKAHLNKRTDEIKQGIANAKGNQLKIDCLKSAYTEIVLMKTAIILKIEKVKPTDEN